MLVTGSTGFLGSHLVRRLRRHGVPVVGTYVVPDELDRLSELRDDEDLILCRVDLRQHCQVDDLFGSWSFHCVFHLAASGVRAEEDSRHEVIEVNTAATASLARTALAHGVRRFVHVGSGFEYEPQEKPIDESAPVRPSNLYGATKAAAFLLLDYLNRVEGLPLVVFRPFSMYGPGEHPSRLVPHVVAKALRGESIDLTHGTQIRDYLFVEDVVDALVVGYERAAAVGGVYNLGSGEQSACTIRTVVELALKAAGAPTDLARFGAIPSKRPEPPFFVADTGKARRELGWAPHVSLEEGLARTVDWFAGHAGTG